MESTSVNVAMGTGPVVEAVLYFLFFISIVSWAIILSKWMSLRQALSSSKEFLNVFWKQKSLSDIFEDSKKHSESPISNVFRAGYLEFQKVSVKGHEKHASTETMATRGMENVQASLRRASVTESLRLEKRLPLLATIASTAPFIGLFGTVWGIMNAYSGIGTAKSISLQTIAPGISGALIATGVALATAIPAVVAYNLFIARLRTIRAEMDNFSIDFTNLLRRSYLE
jgi:biopolymer transport protein TolQ